jgi:hypothetical protein
MKVLNLIIQLNRDWDEQDTWVVSYSVRDDVTSPEEALRSAIQDFMNSGTAEATAALNYACGDFNWGDAMSHIPDSYFINRGLTPLNDRESIDIFVRHDEVLENRNAFIEE